MQNSTLPKTLSLVLGLLVLLPGKAEAQMATIDASNLTQAILAFIQDGDNMALESQQHMGNMEVLNEQSRLLRQEVERYHKVNSILYDSQDILRMARRYESMARMMTSYAKVLKSDLSSGEKIPPEKIEVLVRRGASLLALAMKEVERAKEYLSPSSVLSESERRQGIRESLLSLDGLYSQMSSGIRSSLRELDSGRILKANLEALEDATRL